MANSNPPVKGQEFTYYVMLSDYAFPGNFKENPTIASGDWKVSKDGGALANLNTLPAVTPASSRWVKIVLSATEMDADAVAVQGVDQTSPKEWADFGDLILTTA